MHVGFRSPSLDGPIRFADRTGLIVGIADPAISQPLLDPGLDIRAVVGAPFYFCHRLVPLCSLAPQHTSSSFDPSPRARVDWCRNRLWPAFRHEIFPDT